MKTCIHADGNNYIESQENQNKCPGENRILG